MCSSDLAAEPRSVDEAGVTQPVGQDESASRDQRGNHAQVRQVPRPKDQCGSGLFEAGQCLFQICLRRERAADQTGRAGSCAVLPGCLYRGLNYFGMGRKAQVVVGGEEDDRTAVEPDGWTRGGLKRMEVPGQRSVGQLSEAVLKHGNDSLQTCGPGYSRPAIRRLH